MEILDSNYGTNLVLNSSEVHEAVVKYLQKKLGFCPGQLAFSNDESSEIKVEIIQPNNHNYPNTNQLAIIESMVKSADTMHKYCDDQYQIIRDHINDSLFRESLSAVILKIDSCINDDIIEELNKEGRPPLIIGMDVTILPTDFKGYGTKSKITFGNIISAIWS